MLALLLFCMGVVWIASGAEKMLYVTLQAAHTLCVAQRGILLESARLCAWSPPLASTPPSALRPSSLQSRCPTGTGLAVLGLKKGPCKAQSTRPGCPQSFG